jgi:hypothetical protein
MYKCGWNGCEKAYGTLNHLNAHVTMQSHGSKRTPEGKLILFFFDGRCLVATATRFLNLCRKWLDPVSAGCWTLVSYTRCRGARSSVTDGVEVKLASYPFPPPPHYQA